MTCRDLQEDRHGVAVSLGHSQALSFVAAFMTDARTNGTLRKAYDNNGLKDAPRTE